MRISLPRRASCTNPRALFPATTLQFRINLPSFSRWITSHDDTYTSRLISRSWMRAARRLTSNESTIPNSDRFPTMPERRLLLERSGESWCLTPDLLVHSISHQLYGACNVGNLIHDVYSSIFVSNEFLVSRLSSCSVLLMQRKLCY